MSNIRLATEADIPAIARVHMESWRNTYRGLVSDEFLDNLRLEDRIERWRKRLLEGSFSEFAYVAEDAGGDVIGFATGGREHTGNPLYRGELRALHISREYQGIGIGRALFAEVARELQRHSCNALLLWVLKDNSSGRRFYEQLGGIEVGERIEEFAGGHIEEVAYGWTDLALITGDAR